MCFRCVVALQSGGSPLGVIRAQFIQAYQRRRDRWETAVRETLLQPRAAWDWSLLPGANPLLGGSEPVRLTE